MVNRSTDRTTKTAIIQPNTDLKTVFAGKPSIQGARGTTSLPPLRPILLFLLFRQGGGGEVQI